MSDWWIPRTVEDVEAAVEHGDVTETHHLDFKAFTHAEGDEDAIRVPSATVAKTVAGLAVDGGVLVLGVAEDKPNRRFVCAPRRLTGLRDSVDRIIGASIKPSLRVTINELSRDDGTGYLAVLVPASPRAPHQHAGRYYGRGDTESRVLEDPEVRMLMARHLERRQGMEALLAAEVARDPAPPEMRDTARLFVVAQPVSADPRLLLDAVPDRDLATWVTSLSGTRLYYSNLGYSPGLNESHNVARRAHGVSRSSYAIDNDRTVPLKNGERPNDLTSVVDLEIREDGGLRLYYGRASDHAPRNSGEMMMGTAIVGEVASVIELARYVSEQASFHGAWTFGAALRGIRSLGLYDPNWRWHGLDRKYSEDGYDEVAEVDGPSLTEPGSPVLEAVIGRFLRSTAGTSEDLAQADPFPIERPDVTAAPA